MAARGGASVPAASAVRRAVGHGGGPAAAASASRAANASDAADATSSPIRLTIHKASPTWLALYGPLRPCELKSCVC